MASVERLDLSERAVVSVTDTRLFFDEENCEGRQPMNGICAEDFFGLMKEEMQNESALKNIQEYLDVYTELNL